MSPKRGDITIHCPHISRHQFHCGHWYHSDDLGDEPALVPYKGKMVQVKWLVMCDDCNDGFSGVVGAAVDMDDTPMVLTEDYPLCYQN